MFLAYLTLITALTISAVAIYYSVSGLAAIFAAAVIPIIIMGGVLETAKLVTAVWLHRYWDQAKWWLKTYLSVAVAVLMFITSMGIFGFLSKAHIEQTSLSTEQYAQIQTLDETLTRSQSRIERWDEELNRLLGGGTGMRADSLLQSSQNELNSLYSRIDTEKNVERESVQRQIDQQNQRVDQAIQRRDSALATLGPRPSVEDSNWDSRERSIREAEVNVSSAAQREIRTINTNLNSRLTEIDRRYESQVEQLTQRIVALRNDTTERAGDVDGRIDELGNLIEEEQTKIAEAREEKSVLETQYRRLEAEVGPIKYIAEFIYGTEADKNMLEEAVRWVIIIIIFVFDPLAVLLLIASQYTFEFQRREFGLFGYQKEPEPEPEEIDSEPEPEEIDSEPEISEDDKPIPNTDAFTPLVTPQKPQEIALDFALIQPSIDDMRNALKKWEESKKLFDEGEVSDENIPVSVSEPEPEPEVDLRKFLDKGLIPTDGKTYQRVLGSDYIIDLEGKSIHQDALKQQNPDLFLKADDGKSVNTSFGTDFPMLATKGDIFVRVDHMPNRVYKFMGHKWIEIEKDKSDSYLFDEKYIKHLISKIETGEYDVDLLSDKEKTQIEDYLQNNQLQNE
jgi:hypothetical protein